MLLVTEEAKVGFKSNVAQPVAARAIGHYGQCPPPKIKKEKTVRLGYNSEKNVNFNAPAFFARHPGARDSIISHFVD